MGSEWTKAGWTAAAIFPPLALAAFQIAYAINLPYMDAWELVPYIERAQAGTLRVADLFDQHNAHRIAIPRTWMLILALGTRWDHHIEIAAISLSACAAFSLWCLMLPRHTNENRRAQIALVSMGTFSLAAWRNWTWAWQIQILFCLLFALLCIACLSSDRLGRLRHPIALAAAVAATFSFAAGFAIWPAAGILLALRRAKRRTAALWLAAGALTAAAYFTGFHLPPDVTQFQGARSILSFAAYVFAYLGGGLLAWTPKGACLLGLAATVLMLFLVAKMPSDQRKKNAPVIALASFAFFTAAIGAAGRADEGIAQAVASRYTTFGLVFWIALALLVLQVRFTYQRRACAFAIAMLMALQSVHGAYQGRQRAIYYNDAHAALVAGEPLEDLLRLFPDTALLLERRAYLKANKLSVFRSIEE